MAQKILSKFQNLNYLPRALSLVWESARKWTIISLFLMLIKAVLPLITLYLVKLTVDAITAGLVATDKTAAWREIILLVVITASITLLTSLIQSVAGIVQEVQGQLVTDHVTDIIHRRSAEIDLSYYEDSRYHNTFYRAQQEAAMRPNSIVGTATSLAQNTISLFALAGLLIYLHWGIAVLLLVASLPAVAVKISNSERLFAWRKKRTETERKTYEYHVMLTNLHFAKELRAFNLSNIFRTRYRDLRKILREEKLRLSKIRAKADFLAQIIAVLSLFGIVAYIAWQTLQGVMTLGDMVMYQQAFKRAQSSLGGIMGGIASLYEHNLFLSNFYGFLDLRPRMLLPEKILPVPVPMKKGITLNNISFSYPGMEKEVLKDIDLQIAPGEVVALVGDNGAGKTTLAKLLCRLYDPSGGTIHIDDIDYFSFDIGALRKEIAVIFQDYIHYPFSARENIWLGDVSVDPNSDKIEKAALKAGAHEVITGLSRGYETVLGRRFESGEELSIGEWQKIALSRAFLRDAQLIILDEPTSAMSVQAEYEIFESFKNLLDGRSALLISHRFTTVRMADRICVMENGAIVEQGTHEELIGLKGRYARLYEMQACYYR